MEHSSKLVHPLDPSIFGKGPLAESLAGILNERDNRHLANKVCGFLTDYSRTLKEIDRVESFHAFEYLLGLVREDFLLKTKRWADDPLLHSHVRNFVITGYRNLLRTRTQVNQKTGRIRPLVH